MPAPIDISGQTFGSWTVLGMVRGSHGERTWMCRCVCGKEKVQGAGTLRAGVTKSCGCTHEVKLQGQRFGKLTVIHRTGTFEGNVHWYCKCDCGQYSTVISSNLSSGATNSCGRCPRKDLSGNRYGKLTVERFVRSGDRGAVWACRCDCGNAFETFAERLASGDAISCGCIKSVRNRKELEAYIRSRVVITDSGCWEWSGRRNLAGYGACHVMGSSLLAHRISAFLWLAFDLNSPYIICHKCDNPPCCNPDHLFSGTYSDNTLDCVRKGRQKEVRKTHCVNGHEFTPENTALESKKSGRTRRHCITCRREKNRRASAKQREQYNSVRRVEPKQIQGDRTMGGTFSKIGDFASGAGDAVKGTGQSVGELKDIGYSPADIAQLGGGTMSTGQKVAKTVTGVAGAGLQSIGQQQQQRPGGYGSPIQVAPTPDVSAYYPVQPLTMPGQQANPNNQNDPFSAFFRR